jgi:hypothetical protein
MFRDLKDAFFRKPCVLYSARPSPSTFAHVAPRWTLQFCMGSANVLGYLQTTSALGGSTGIQTPQPMKSLAASKQSQPLLGRLRLHSTGLPEYLLLQISCVLRFIDGCSTTKSFTTGNACWRIVSYLCRFKHTA